MTVWTLWFEKPVWEQHVPLKLHMLDNSVLNSMIPSSNCHFKSCQGFTHKCVSCKNQNSVSTQAHMGTPRCRRSSALGGHSDPAICCCNQTLKRWPDAHTHVCMVRPHVRTSKTHLQHTRAHVLPNIHMMASKQTHTYIWNHTHTHTQSSDTHFERADCQHINKYAAFTHTLSRQAQIAGSSLHAAQSTAAGTNQHNPPADRYGSLTATHTVTNTHRNLPEQSLAHTGSDMSTRAINRSISEHTLSRNSTVYTHDAVFMFTLVWKKKTNILTICLYGVTVYLW